MPQEIAIIKCTHTHIYNSVSVGQRKLEKSFPWGRYAHIHVLGISRLRRQWPYLRKILLEGTPDVIETRISSKMVENLFDKFIRIIVCFLPSTTSLKLISFLLKYRIRQLNLAPPFFFTYFYSWMLSFFSFFFRKWQK